MRLKCNCWNQTKIPCVMFHEVNSEHTLTNITDIVRMRNGKKYGRFECNANHKLNWNSVVFFYHFLFLFFCFLLQRCILWLCCVSSTPKQMNETNRDLASHKFNFTNDTFCTVQLHWQWTKIHIDSDLISNDWSKRSKNIIIDWMTLKFNFRFNF